jgi:hypothetical protein
MANKILVFLSLLFGTILSVKGQGSAPKIVLNHFLVIVDSITYQEILKSKILNSDFAYSHEKKLNGYSGIYILGQDNYIEVFSPNSIENEYHEPGNSWICYSSMKANYLKELNSTRENKFEFSSDNEFDYLSIYFQDSTNLITTWEMKKSHYENWSKKTFNDSVSFLSVDYNSPEESDSSKNYLFNNILGIKVLVNSADSTTIIDYMKLIGYSKIVEKGNSICFSNSVDFIEMDFQIGVTIPTVTTVFMELKNERKAERIEIGKSVLYIERNQATWEFNLESKEK